MSAPFGKPISAVDIRISKPKLVAAIESSTEGNAAIAVEGLDQKAQLSKGLVSVCHELNLKEEVHGFYAFMSRQGKAHVLMTELGNIYAIEVKSKAFKSIVRKAIKRKGGRLNRNQVTEIIEEIEADAFDNGVMLDVYYRVGPTDGGFEYDLGDAEHTRYRVTGGVVDKVSSGSKVIFVRNNVMLEMPVSDAGDLSALRTFVNLDHFEWVLFLAAVSYYISHPKVPGAEYPILAFISGQGTGKSFLSNMAQCLVDKNTVGLQTLPRRIKDIIIAMNHTHLLCLDNLRYLRTQHSDLLCVSATSGSFIDRALYTDGDMHVSSVQCPVILNGIHDFYDQSDLAERMLVLHPKVIDPATRKSKIDLLKTFEQELPSIFKGLMDYAAKILKHLPTTTPTAPARLYDFSHWLAAMEKVDDAPEGAFQDLYRDNLKQTQLDSLLENPLAAAMVQFFELQGDKWKNEPMFLLAELSELVPISVRRSQDWPSNSIALTKRLKALQAGLHSQGIYIDFGRDKKRWITVTTSYIEDQY
jgi:hypothetical protein